MFILFKYLKVYNCIDIINKMKVLDFVSIIEIVYISKLNFKNYNI
jgi:hypothetical protein